MEDKWDPNQRTGKEEMLISSEGGSRQMVGKPHGAQERGPLHKQGQRIGHHGEGNGFWALTTLLKCMNNLN